LNWDAPQWRYSVSKKFVYSYAANYSWFKKLSKKCIPVAVCTFMMI
jgi:hypothetical protein